jgi:integrase
VTILTDAMIRKLKPGTKRRIIRDGGAKSLFLVIQAKPSVRKSFMMRFRGPDGVPQKMVLGPFHDGPETPGTPSIGEPLTLAGARVLATLVLRERAQGLDPVANHKARRHRARIQAEPATAFGAVAKRFLEQHAKVETRRWKETYRLIGYDYEGQVIPGSTVEHWFDKPIDTIDVSDVWEAIEAAGRISKGRARALHARLSKLFSWARGQRLDGKPLVLTNPCVGVAKPKVFPARVRVLSDDEIRAMWAGCGEIGLCGQVVRLLLVTGARLREVADMTWDEIRDDGTWLIPGHRTKNGREHLVPLTEMARAIIASTPRVAGSRWVFSFNGRNPPKDFPDAKARLDAIMRPATPWRLHDCRRTFVTRLAELDIPVDLIEVLVNHVSGQRAGVAGVYNRSIKLPQRRAALDRWCTTLEGIISGRESNVISMVSK